MEELVIRYTMTIAQFAAAKSFYIESLRDVKAGQNVDEKIEEARKLHVEAIKSYRSLAYAGPLEDELSPLQIECDLLCQSTEDFYILALIESGN